MTAHRYVVPGAFNTAFTPFPVKAAPLGGQSYKQNVVGQPGTQGIPAPYPAGVGSDIDQFRDGAPAGSSYAPARWYPSLYYDTGARAALPGDQWGGASVYSDNQLPIPAIDPTRGTHRYGGGVLVQPDQQKWQKSPGMRLGQTQVGQRKATGSGKGWRVWPQR